MPQSRLRIAFLAACFCSLAFQFGCGDGRPTRVPISGQVTIDGQPLKFGSILFQPESGRASSSRLDENGRYKLSTYERGDGAIPGAYAVAVSANEQMGEVSQRWHAPKKYRDPVNSGLNATVEGPREDLNFELSWEGGKPFVEKL